MNKDIFTYLRSYSTDPEKVNRLVVSAFLRSFNVNEIHGQLLNLFWIEQDEQEYGKLLEFLTIHKFSDIEELIEIFEFVISPKEKIVTGAIYTPRHIREYIVEQCFAGITSFKNLKICDPACGCAGFLYTTAKYIKEKTNLSYAEIIEQNIFGLDIQEFSVTRSKLLLTLVAFLEEELIKNISFNLFQGNALNFNWSNVLEGYEGFDIIVGNPPYVCSRNIDQQSRILLENWSVCSTGHPDLYIPFFELGITNLKENGTLGYITMNTFFKSINGRALRNYLSQFDNTVIDFGGYQVFNSKSTYTCICLIKKQSLNHIKYAKINSVEDLNTEILFEKIEFEALDHFNGWNLQDIDLLHKIESLGTPLGKKFKTRNGIATLKNSIYIFSPISEDENFYYLQNGNTYPIEKGICRDIINSNKFTRIKSVEHIKQKIIFPYKYIAQNIEIINEKDFTKKYPKAYKYLRDKKKILATRDKGKKQYEKWYAYGRNQSLEKMPHKLFFPHISSNIPNFIINNDEELLFYNGLALIGKNQKELSVMQKIMGSRLFWYYVTKSSKPYGSGYYSLSRNYIKKFGIPEFSDNEIEFLTNESDIEKINTFIEEKYKCRLNS